MPYIENKTMCYHDECENFAVLFLEMIKDFHTFLNTEKKNSFYENSETQFNISKEHNVNNCCIKKSIKKK